MNVKKALCNFEKNKSPGNDGLTVEFYFFFWNDIADMLVNCYIESHNEYSLTTSQRQAIIILLEKRIKIEHM